MMPRRMNKVNDHRLCTGTGQRQTDSSKRKHVADVVKNPSRQQLVERPLPIVGRQQPSLLGLLGNEQLLLQQLAELEELKIEKKKRDDALAARFMCMVCQETTRSLSRWPVCGHFICLICLQKWLDAPFTKQQDENKTQPPDTAEEKAFQAAKNMWHGPTFAFGLQVNPEQNGAVLKEVEVELFINFVHRAIIYKVSCPICRQHLVNRFHHERDGFTAAPNVDEDLPPSSELVPCPHAGCPIAFDGRSYSTNELIRHVMYQCPQIVCPCPFKQGCFVSCPAFSVYEKRIQDRLACPVYGRSSAKRYDAAERQGNFYVHGACASRPLVASKMSRKDLSLSLLWRLVRYSWIHVSSQKGLRTICGHG